MEGFLNRNSGSSTTIFSSPLHSSSVTGLQFQPVNLPTSSPTFGSTSMRRPLFNSIQKKILVLDLDETLVHASTNFSEDCDFSLRLSISGSPCNFYVFKRPHVELFLEMVSTFLISFFLNKIYSNISIQIN